MNISIFGLGYVGAVTAACLAKAGHTVIGVDFIEAKVLDLGRGVAPIAEPGLDVLLEHAIKDGRLSSTMDHDQAISRSEASIICVGTPSLESGGLNLTYVNTVCEQISSSLKARNARHLLIFRSTVLPGTMRYLVSKWFAGLIENGLVEVVFCPEFMREGSAVSDFVDPAISILGSSDGQAIEKVETFMGQSTWFNWEGAEMIKYACNYWHALKVGFANEIGRLGKHIGVDSQSLMASFIQDTKLNVSPYYMRPGTPFGGSCLPKDVNALLAFTRQQGVHLPLLGSVLATNQSHLDSLVRLVTTRCRTGVLILGLTFKEGTDDLRGSPMVMLAETMLGRGYKVLIYDPNLDLDQVVGENRHNIMRRMPHLAKLLVGHPSVALPECDVVVAAHRNISADELGALLTPDHRVIDVNGWDALRASGACVEGLCW